MGETTWGALFFLGGDFSLSKRNVLEDNVMSTHQRSLNINTLKDNLKLTQTHN